MQTVDSMLGPRPEPDMPIKRETTRGDMNNLSHDQKRLFS